MGLGHKYIIQEVELSEVARAYYAVPKNVDQILKDTQDYLQESLEAGEVWDEYFDLKIKFSTEYIVRDLSEKSNYYRYFYDIVGASCSRGKHTKITIHCQINPFFDKKDSFHMELKSKDFVE